jgi:hypothetical protein
MSGDDAFSYTVKLKRGGGDDVQKVTVTAPDIETLETRVEAVRERLERWAGDYREIQPDDSSRRLTDDQSSLREVGES